MEFLNVIKKNVQEKKEIYYPLFSIILFFLVNWIITLLINPTELYMAMSFLIGSFSFLMFICSRDIYYKVKSNEINLSKRIIFFFSCLSIVLSFTVGFYFIILIITNIYNIIPIGIYFLIMFLIYFIIKIQLRKYYKLRDKRKISYTL